MSQGISKIEIRFGGVQEVRWDKGGTMRAGDYILFSMDKYSGDQIDKIEMGWECSTYGSEKRCMQAFAEKPEGKNHLEDRGLEGRVILR